MSNLFGKQIQQNVNDYGKSVESERANQNQGYQEYLKTLNDEDVVIMHHTYPGNRLIKFEIQRRGLFKDYGIR